MAHGPGLAVELRRRPLALPSAHARGAVFSIGKLCHLLTYNIGSLLDPFILMTLFGSSPTLDS